MESTSDTQSTHPLYWYLFFLVSVEHIYAKDNETKVFPFSQERSKVNLLSLAGMVR